MWLGWLTLGSVWGQEPSPHKVLGRYQLYVWQDQHGLPQNGVLSIARTRDGYLWLGTVEGAARFDGVRFTVFDSNNTNEIRSSQITALLEDHAGNLWLGTNVGGLNRYRDGRFTLFTTQQGLSNDQIRCLFEDHAGDLWIGTFGGGLNRFSDGRFSALTARDGLPSDQVWAIAEDQKGAIWIGTGNGLARFKDGRFTVFTTRDGLARNTVYALCLDRAGDLWVGSDSGKVSRFKDGRFTVYDLSGVSRNRITTIYEDRNGIIWVGTAGDGLYQLNDGRFTAWTTKDGLPSNRVLTIYHDPDGDLWVGTEDSGVCQLRDGRFRVYTKADGLPSDFARAIYEDTAGNLWVGTVGGGLGKFRAGVFTVYTTKDGLPSNTINSISEDAAGTLWFNGVSRYKDGRFTNWAAKEGLSPHGVTVALADRAGNLWMGTSNSGLNRFRDGHFTTFTTRDGLADNYIVSLFEDRSGNLWIGTLNGGVSRFRDGSFATWTTKDGLGSNHVLAFFEDRTGTLWIGTHGGGLTRLKDGKLTTITVKDGLYDNLAFQILLDREDESGNLWMSCNKGIYRASLKELNDFADGRIPRVTSFAYGVADGMLSRECNGANPAGWKTRDGRLWFPTIRGVVVIDPQNRDLQPPLVAIESVTLDRVALPIEELARRIQIGPGQANLEIQYTGLSWSRPAQIKFKYQLLGLDKTWVEAGTRRTAYYPHLPPGEYTFKVIADNGEGVWNMTGKELRIIVLPPFYRTWWFLTLVALSVVGMIVFAYQYRVRQLERAQEAQQAFSRLLIASQESERKRIASELHDSLGQTLAIIKNRALLGGSASTDLESAKEQFSSIAAQSTQAIDEAKEISYNLRPYLLDRLGLSKALESMIRKVADSSGIRFTIEISEVDGLFAPDEEINLYRIAQECLNNIIKHSGASAAAVRLRREQDWVELVVSDDGKGFSIADWESRVADWKAAELPGGENPQSPIRKPQIGGGFGLMGIRERARLFQAVPTLLSTPGEGTTITIRFTRQMAHTKANGNGQ